MNDAPERARYRCRSEWGVWGWIALGVAVLGALVATKMGAPPGLPLLGAVAFGFVLLMVSIPVDVEVGHDGVTIRRFGRRKLLPYGSIESVEVRQREGSGKQDRASDRTLAWTVHLSVVFKLKGGAEVELATGEDEVDPGGTHIMGRVGSFGATDPVSRGIVRDVRERLRALRAHEPSVLEQDLARGDRSVAEWFEDLARLAHLAQPATDAYRATSLDKEALWTILESPTAAPTARAGAAVVLRKMLDTEDEPRVRVAVEGCELSNLRVALEHALIDEEDGDELRMAIARID